MHQPSVKWCEVMLLLTSLSATPGCLINSHTEKVVDSDVPRRAVQFESDAGMSDFQKEVQQRYSGGGGRLGASSFGVPFVVGASQTKVLSESAFYNQQVAKADVNGDATLSDGEVRAYLAAK